MYGTLLNNNRGMLAIRIRKVHLVTASLSQYQCLDQNFHLVQLSYGHWPWRFQIDPT